MKKILNSALVVSILLTVSTTSLLAIGGSSGSKSTMQFKEK